MNNYCLYRHIRLDKNEVFYIGIGNYERPFSKHARNRYWHYITDKTNYDVEVLMYELSRKEAEEKEKEFIKLYGRKDLNLGTLVNMTDGGSGGLGLKHTDEAKNKMKARKPHNKGFRKHKNLEDQIIDKIKNGLSESKIQKEFNISKGSIYRLKQQIKNK